MSLFDLEDTLRATVARERETDAIERLTGRRDWVLALAGWLGLRRGEAAPSREAIAIRLTLEIEAIDRMVSRQLDAVL
ncbi:MAG: hypothetical protein AAGI22_27940, partial [Planctomycetota bacterium]